MPTAAKAQTIEELSQKLQDSKGAVLLDYRGLNVADISELRRQLTAQEVEFHVAKNTLLKIAADRAKVDVEPELLTGPTAIAFGWRDEVSPAKLLSDFVRRNRVVSIKGGIIAGHSVGAAAVERIASLPNRETLLAQFISTLQSPLSRALAIMQAPARELAGLAEALRSKTEAAETVATAEVTEATSAEATEAASAGATEAPSAEATEAASPEATEAASSAEAAEAPSAEATEAPSPEATEAPSAEATEAAASAEAAEAPGSAGTPEATSETDAPPKSEATS